MDFKKFVKKEGTYVLIGNKIDLKEQRVVSSEDGKKLADEIKASDHIETSAKLNQNVEIAFKNLILKVLRNHGEKI
jgi:GTPase SAR1 family protein